MEPATISAARLLGFQEVQRILKEAKVPFDITNKSLDLPELQGEPEEVALEKCKLAAKEVRAPQR